MEKYFFSIKLFLLIIFYAPLSAQPALTEQEALTQAIQRHPAIAAAVYKVQQQEKLIKTAKNWEPTDFFHNITADPELGIFGTVTAGISQTFPNPRQTRARSDHFRHLQAYAETGRQLAQRDVVRQVREIYRHLGYLGDKVNLFRQLDSLYSRIAEIAEIRYRSGDAALAEKLALEDKAGQVRLALETLGHEIDFDELVLGQLLGAPGPVKTVAEPLRAIEFSLADTVRLLSAAFARHNAQAVELAQADQNLAAAKKIPVFGAGVYGQYLANGLVYPGWQVSLQVPLDRSSRHAAEQAAAIAVQAAQADYRAALLQQRTELAHLLHEQEKYQIELQYYESRGKHLAKELTNHAVVNYRAGELDYWELTQQLQQASLIELNRLENLYGLNLTIIELLALID